MHTTTVIVILSAHLITTGCLLLLIGQRTPKGAGLGWFSVGCITFGASLACRLWAGPRSAALGIVVLDASMAASMFFFHAGLLQFVGRTAPPLRWLVAALPVYMLVAALVTLGFGVSGRHALLNLTMGSAQVAFFVVAARSVRGAAPTLRAPLVALAGTMGGLGAISLVRAAIAASLGIDAMFGGLLAQVYTGYGSLVGLLLGPLVLWMVFMRLNARLAELATHDALTRLLNRAGLAEVLQRHFGSRKPLPLSVLQIDIDHFKQVNDAHGHGAGDAVLCAVAETLAHSMRLGDFTARTGGEEFLVGCIASEPGGAAALAERLRDAVAALRIDAVGQVLQCTVSIGVSMPVSRLEEWPRALRQADEALYAAKQAGRNRVMVAACPGSAGVASHESRRRPVAEPTSMSGPGG